MKLVEIADTPDDFIRAAEKILSRPNDAEWLARVDSFLANVSWDKTWKQMSDLIDGVVERKRRVTSTTVPLNRVGQRAGAVATP
jgi:UDP-galactopyranose mutase